MRGPRRRALRLQRGLAEALVDITQDCRRLVERQPIVAQHRDTAERMQVQIALRQRPERIDLDPFVGQCLFGQRQPDRTQVDRKPIAIETQRHPVTRAGPATPGNRRRRGRAGLAPDRVPCAPRFRPSPPGHRRTGCALRCNVGVISVRNRCQIGLGFFLRCQGLTPRNPARAANGGALRQGFVNPAPAALDKAPALRYHRRMIAQARLRQTSRRRRLG